MLDVDGEYYKIPANLDIQNPFRHISKIANLLRSANKLFKYKRKKYNEANCFYLGC